MPPATWMTLLASSPSSCLITVVWLFFSPAPMNAYFSVTCGGPAPGYTPCLIEAWSRPFSFTREEPLWEKTPKPKANFYLNLKNGSGGTFCVFIFYFLFSPQPAAHFWFLGTMMVYLPGSPPIIWRQDPRETAEALPICPDLHIWLNFRPKNVRISWIWPKITAANAFVVEASGLKKARKTSEFERLRWQLVPSEIAVEHPACVRKFELPFPSHKVEIFFALTNPFAFIEKKVFVKFDGWVTVIHIKCRRSLTNVLQAGGAFKFIRGLVPELWNSDN